MDECMLGNPLALRADGDSAPRTPRSAVQPVTQTVIASQSMHVRAGRWRVLRPGDWAGELHMVIQVGRHWLLFASSHAVPEGCLRPSYMSGSS